MWAYAVVRQLDRKLFTSLTRSADRRIGEFHLQDVVNAAWALSTVRQSDEKVFAALARAAKRRVSDLKLLDLANILWAFASHKVCVWSLEVFVHV